MGSFVEHQKRTTPGEISQGVTSSVSNITNGGECRGYFRYSFERN